jgi:hypothetical protein
VSEEEYTKESFPDSYVMESLYETIPEFREWYALGYEDDLFWWWNPWMALGQFNTFVNGLLRESNQPVLERCMEWVEHWAANPNTASLIEVCFLEGLANMYEVYAPDKPLPEGLTNEQIQHDWDAIKAKAHAVLGPVSKVLLKKNQEQWRVVEAIYKERWKNDPDFRREERERKKRLFAHLQPANEEPLP